MTPNSIADAVPEATSLMAFRMHSEASMKDTNLEKQKLAQPKKAEFKLKKQLLTKKRFFYFSGSSEAQKELRESEFGGGVENSSVRTLKLELKPS
ncbi:MAG: hypothetical protein AAF202_14340 [Pseudomonadota bacterium]